MRVPSRWGWQSLEVARCIRTPVFGNLLVGVSLPDPRWRWLLVNAGQTIRGTDDGDPEAIHDVSVDHGGLHILVPQQFLDAPDIGPIFQKMGSEGVTEGVRYGGFGDLGV